MAELQKKLTENKKNNEKTIEKNETENPDDILKNIFVGRAWEVWNNAKHQYPSIIGEIRQMILILHNEKRITKPITGEQLMGLFRRIGLNVRLKTSIKIFEHGELKTIADKVKERYN
jgi:DNA-binding TFAR19-related protein (PDSD5 family)